MTKPTSKSEELIAELVKSKIITDHIDEVKARLIIRRYFIDVFSDGVESERCARNHKIYNQPTYQDKKQ
jgi:hypothetical protein